jgi:hypothetical protein
MKVQRCQRQQPLWDQTRSVCLVNCVGAAHVYFGISGWLVHTPMVSTSICSPSPSGTSLAPFRKTLSEGYRQHFYARYCLSSLHCVAFTVFSPLVTGARCWSTNIYNPMASGGQHYHIAYKFTQGQPNWPALFHCGRWSIIINSWS